MNILAVPVPNGSYTLSNGVSNLFLADPAGSTTPGTQMVQAAATGGLEQQWQFVFQQGAYYTIQNDASQLYLTDPGSSNTPGVTLQQMAATNDDSQLWALTPTGNAYSVTNKATGLAIDDPGWSTTGGAGIDLWVATGTANQAWSINGMTSPWPSGNYLLVNGASDLLLADPGSSTTPGTQMVQWSVTGRNRFGILPFSPPATTRFRM